MWYFLIFTYIILSFFVSSNVTFISWYWLNENISSSAFFECFFSLTGRNELLQEVAALLEDFLVNSFISASNVTYFRARRVKMEWSSRRNTCCSHTNPTVCQFKETLLASSHIITKFEWDDIEWRNFTLENWNHQFSAANVSLQHARAHAYVTKGHGNRTLSKAIKAAGMIHFDEVFSRRLFSYKAVVLLTSRTSSAESGPPLPAAQVLCAWPSVTRPLLSGVSAGKTSFIVTPHVFIILLKGVEMEKCFLEKVSFQETFPWGVCSRSSSVFEILLLLFEGVHF